MRLIDDEKRIQFKVTRSEKEYFKLGAKLLGFRNLSEFIRVSAFEKIKKFNNDSL